ncbi:MAG: tRNA-specific adenosine deaminase [Phycisphaerae bacterium]|nr:tRNA-specific adenosine deaminase [Phycisphaerae bacterium]
MSLTSLKISLPDWVASSLPEANAAFETAEERMGLAIELALRNVAERTGGPFGACVFEVETGRLLAAGVNLVQSSGLSVAHGEIVAIVAAQRAIGHYDLAAPGSPPYELVTSCEPCTMCLGAAVWSGVRRLICGARESDAEAAGFDEGPKVRDWPEQLAARGIEVIRDVRRAEAADVLRQYVAGGGEIYNSLRSRTGG